MTKARLAAGCLFQLGDGTNNVGSTGNDVLSFPTGTTGGTFTLSYNGFVTAAITFTTVTATLATNIQTALNALPNVGAKGGSFAVVGAGTGPYTATVTPGGIFANYPIPALVVNAANITPANTVVTVTHTAGVAAGQAYATIAELTSLPFPAPKRATKDVTSFDSPNLYREFIGDYKDAGDIKIDANFVNDITQNYAVGMISKFEGGATYSFRILVNDYPNNAGTAIQVPGVTLTFSGFFTEVAITGAKPEDVMTVTGTLKITGSVGYSIALP